jgi:hypothetical protein
MLTCEIAPKVSFFYFGEKVAKFGLNKKNTQTQQRSSNFFKKNQKKQTWLK